MSSGYDLVFRDATIADGSGGPLMRGDLAVRDGRIAALGTVPGRGEREIDAGGRVLAPGAVDVHTHYDAQLTWDRTASPSPSLGVTTILIGNCGFGIAPAPPAARDLLLKNLSEVEAMSLDSLQAGVNWEFETFGQYLDMLERRSVYPNVAAYASHSVMRTVVMGAAGSERAATADELGQMGGLLRDAMASGAAGMGSSTFENHNGYGGIPVPSRLADDEEFRAFARVIGEFGHGSMMATCGNRTSIEFLEELAGLSKRPAAASASNAWTLSAISLDKGILLPAQLGTMPLRFVALRTSAAMSWVRTYSSTRPAKTKWSPLARRPSTTQRDRIRSAARAARCV